MLVVLFWGDNVWRVSVQFVVGRATDQRLALRSNAKFVLCLSDDAFVKLGLANVGARYRLPGSCARHERMREFEVTAIAQTIRSRINRLFLFLVRLVTPNCCCVCAQGEEQSNDIRQEQQCRRDPRVWLDCFVVEAVMEGRGL